MAGGKDRGQGFTTCGSNLVAMSAGHLLQQALSAEEAQLPADSGRLSAGLLGGTSRQIEQQGPKVAVA